MAITAREADVVFESVDQGTDILLFGSLTTDVNLNLGSRAPQAVHDSRTLKLNSGATFENAIGGSGNDTLRGNSLNNTLTGNAGNDLLLGNAGDDRLYGGGGRNILIGGDGSDRLTGGTDEDLLLGARYIYEANITRLTALMTEWASASSFADRVAHLLGTASGGLNGTTALKSATVKEDGARDVLIGSSGKDWYLRNRLGAVVVDRDTVNDTDLDSIFTEISSWL